MTSAIRTQDIQVRAGKDKLGSRRRLDCMDKVIGLSIVTGFQLRLKISCARQKKAA